MTDMNTNNNQENNVQPNHTKGEQLLDSVKTCSKKIFTKKNFKKAVAAVVVVAAICGGASYYNHQQRVAAHEQMVSAQNRIIETQAANSNIMLLDQNQIKSISANAVGQDESSLSFKEIALIDMTHVKNNNYHNGPKGNHADPGMNDHKNGQPSGPQNNNQPAPMNGNQPMMNDAQPMMNGDNAPMMAPQGQPPVQQGAEQSTAPATNEANQNNASSANQGQSGNQTPAINGPTIKPIYLVSMIENKVHYKVAVDAVSGQVLNIDVSEGGHRGGPRF